MKHYLPSIYRPDEDPPPREVRGPTMRNVDALIHGKAADVWVFNGSRSIRVRAFQGEADD